MFIFSNQFQWALSCATDASRSTAKRTPPKRDEGKKQMIISDQEIYHILSILKNREPVLNSTFTATIDKEVPHIPSGHFRQRLTEDNLIKYNKDDDTILLSKNGIQFLRIYNRRLKRDNFNQWALFFKNIFLVISYIVLILLNLFQFLKLIKVF